MHADGPGFGCWVSILAVLQVVGLIFENSILDVTTTPGRTTSKSLRFLRTPFRQELPLKVEKRAKGKKAWDATLLRLRGLNKGLGLRV